MTGDNPFDLSKPRFHGGVFGTPTGPTSEWQPPKMDPAWDKQPNAEGKIELELTRKTSKLIERHRLPGETDDQVIDRKLKITEGNMAARFARDAGIGPSYPSAARFNRDLETRSASFEMNRVLDGIDGKDRESILRQLKRDMRNMPTSADLIYKATHAKVCLGDIVAGRVVGQGAFELAMDSAIAVMPMGVRREAMIAAKGELPMTGARLAMALVDERLLELEESLRPTEQALADLKRKKAGLEFIIQIAAAPQLQKLGETGYHKLLTAWRAGDIFAPSSAHEWDKSLESVLGETAQCIVVQHDWAAAFANAQDFAEGGEFRMPYDETIFEFRISGARVISCVATHDDAANGPSSCITCIETPVGWAMAGYYNLTHGKWVSAKGHDADPIMALVGAQIRAIAITLEAEVAVTEVMRAPHKLNAKRARAGKLPIFDYHVVSLARRARALPLPPAEGEERGTHASPRLHFRRGHWRHFETHKTWIKWMLVGNADLGFVDKHYRL